METEEERVCYREEVPPERFGEEYIMLTEDFSACHAQCAYMGLS